MNPAPKRILYCEGNTDSSVGGSHYSLFYLVESLDKSLYSPIVVFHRENRLIPMYRQAGLDTRVFHYPQGVQYVNQQVLRGLARYGLKVLQNGINFWRMLLVPTLRCAWYLRVNHVDLVHLNNTIIRNHHWVLGSALAGVKCISHERGINDRTSWLSHFCANRMKAIVCISYAVRDNLLIQGIDPAKLVVVHNGLDPNRVRATTAADEVRRRHAIEPGWPVIGIIGNIKAWKGQDVVVRATERLRQRWPEIQCLLVGDTEVDQEYEHRLRKLVTERSLEKNIVFTGYQSNVADYVNIMDVVIHASVLPEPFGRVLLEAMSMKKPVVGARAGAIPEIISEGETGWMFTPNDDQELAQHTARLLENPELARAMGENGYLRAAHEFGIAKNVQSTELLYRQLLS